MVSCMVFADFGPIAVYLAMCSSGVFQLLQIPEESNLWATLDA